VEAETLILALQLGRDEFVARFPEPLLVGDGALEHSPELQHQDTSPPRPGAEPLPSHTVRALRPTGRVVTDYVSVGRGLENDIVIVDETISKTHAIFSRAAVGWTLADVGSRNGTWVGNRRLTGTDEPVPVPLGARIRLGDVTLTLVDSGDFWDRLRRA
jgi:pSer/pThr/pTyr-binding forkhead associated (FHA) protein